MRFDIPTVTAAVRQRTAEVSQANARVEQARASAARLAGLFERGVAARKDVEDARRELADAEGALAQAESAAAAAGSLAARAIVRAPFAGMVAKRWHNAGTIVEPGAGDPILRVIDPGAARGRCGRTAGGPAADRRGTSCARARARRRCGTGSRRQPAGRRRRVERHRPRAALVHVHRRASRPACPYRWRSRQRSTPNVVVVPSAAIVREGAETLAVVAGPDQKAHRKTVSVGLASGSDVEIRSGLAAGDRVIVKGQDALPDGAAITVSP